MYYLCEKYYEPITIRYYIASVIWAPRVSLLDLQILWIYKCVLVTELV